MTEYEYNFETFEKAEGTIEIPDNAVGVSVDYFGDLTTVKYLAPVDQ